MGKTGVKKANKRGTYVVEYNGMLYSSRRALVDSLGKSYSIVNQRIQRGETLEEALSDHYFYEGKGYFSMEDIAKAYNVPVSTISARHMNKKFSMHECIHGKNKLTTEDFARIRHNGKLARLEREEEAWCDEMDYKVFVSDLSYKLVSSCLY